MMGSQGSASYGYAPLNRFLVPAVAASDMTALASCGDAGNHEDTHSCSGDICSGERNNMIHWQNGELRSCS